jgi:hypothetical protein
MEKNVGNLDRGVRVVVGLGLLSMCFTWPHTIWGLLGVVPFSTAVLGYYPVYRLFGIRTCPLER